MVRFISKNKVILCLITCFITFENSSGQTTFKRAGDYYALERNEQALTSYIFTEVSEFVEGKAWVNQGELYGYIDTLGQPITAYLYADVGGYTNGFAAVSKDTQDGYYGFIDAQGSEICPLQFTRVLPFKIGYAAVQKDTSWSLIDSTGVQLFEAVYDYPPLVISSRFVIVSQNLKWGVIDVIGNKQYDFIYDLITPDGTAYLQNKKVYLGLL
ncbi:MAG: hypothetical protein ACI8SE_001277 [Bacteroidia bacterium]|jgi:hypothetical protein